MIDLKERRRRTVVGYVSTKYRDAEEREREKERAL